MIVSSFIIQANVITIVNYDRKTFIVQATGGKWQQRRLKTTPYVIKIKVGPQLV